MGLSLARALRFAGPRSAAFVGSGGKTTSMFQLARELPPPVLVTTSAHLGAWQIPLADQHVVAQEPADLAPFQPVGVTLITGRPTLDDRFEAVGPSTLKWLRDFCLQRGLPLLIEADGSRGLPLKAPGPHEPAIPQFVDIVVVVAGLNGLGRPLNGRAVHRPEQFATLSGLSPEQPVGREALARVLTHPEGGLKNIPAGARRVVLLNRADTLELQSEARSVARSLLPAFASVIVARMQDHTVFAVHEAVAGIVLAAGGSSRFGRPKPLLDWHGRPFVRAVVDTATQAGLSPVVAVTGAHADEVEAALNAAPPVLARNDSWQSGQASSIHAGLYACPPSIGAAVFLLADQPQITSDVISALVDTHAQGLQPIVAPLVMMEQRANPVLFDRDTFTDLLSLEGDVGGRAVFAKHRVEYMPWHDDRLLLDVDTEADYRRLIQDDTL